VTAIRRDPRLHGLSHEHHHALVLVRTLRKAVADPSRLEAAGEQLDRALVDTLEPHFLVEERLLLPGLAAAGEHELVRRTEADHAFLRAQAGARSVEALAAFADRLEAHVRFEERQLFGAAERTLDEATLAALAEHRATAGCSVKAPGDGAAST